MRLFSAAERYAKDPSDVDAMTTFMESLAQEQSIDEITKILPLDFERIAGPALSRIADLRPDDVDVLLDVILWNYHFGLDEEAHKYLEHAKRASPYGLNVLQVEIFLSYGNDLESVLSLCRTALALFPSDEWLLEIKQTIEDTGQLDEMRSPPIKSIWQTSFPDAS